MKRILSGIFAALLILCALPVAAFAEQQPSDIDPITVQPISASGGEIVRPTWLAYGPITQYPAEGGTWEYGFWDAKVRSYYTVNRCHGSTVVLNGNTVRSVDTAAGEKSIAENGQFSGLRTMTAITTVFATEYPFSSSFFEQLG